MQGEGQGEPPPVLSSTHCLTTAYQQQPQQGHLKLLLYHPSTFPLHPNRGPSIPLPPTPPACLSTLGWLAPTSYLRATGWSDALGAAL